MLFLSSKMSSDEKSAPTMIKEKLFLVIFCFFLWNKCTAQKTDAPSDLAVVEAPVGEETNPKNIDIELNIGTRNKKIQLHLERNDNLNMDATVFVPRVDASGKSVLVKELVPVDTKMSFYQDENHGAAVLMKCEELAANAECERTLVGSLYVGGEEFSLQPIDQGARRKRQVSITIGKNGKKKTSVMYGLFKKKRPNKAVNWEMNKKTKDFKQAWQEIRKVRGRKRPTTNKRPGALSGTSWRKTSNKGVPVFTPSPVDEIPSDTGTDSDPLIAFNALSSRSKKKLVVDSTQNKVLGESMVNAFRPTAFAMAKQKTVVATVTSEYNIGILLALDYATYDRFYQKAIGATEKERDTKAKQTLRAYFSQVINGIALRYKTIKADFSLNIVVTGFIIVDAPDYPCFTCGKVKNVFDDSLRELTNIESALKNITEFRQKTQLPEHDHLMLFTDLDLYYSPTKNSYQTDVTGFAYVGALCTQASTSVIEDFGNYESLFTAAHELGHSLGAQHDGYGNDCSEMDQYLLTAVSGQTTETTKLNPWKFSDCSINYFRDYIANISKDGSQVENCLADEALIYNTEEFNQNIGTLPGQLVHPNDQCKAAIGPASYYGWGGVLKTYGDICTSMACNTGEGATLFVFNTAYRGTSCGDKKWCIEGQCVYDPEAPSKNPSCVHGDILEKFSFLEKSCAQTILETPALCYKDPYNYKCCESCERAANKSNPDCPYGDRADSCSKVLTNPSLCYIEERECCATCEKVNTGPAGCEYGDRIDSCKVLECGKDQAYRDDCCETCADYVATTSTAAPTEPPTPAPTEAPTPAPTEAPTPAPTEAPTPAPTEPPTPAPTEAPTPAPTEPPTPAPTEAPTPAPTPAPTEAPTPAPTEAPTPAPTEAPTEAPTPAPTEAPTPAPTQAPTPAPTPAPTLAPSTVSPYENLCVKPFAEFGFRTCAEIAGMLYIPCHNDWFRTRCCKECTACSDKQTCGQVEPGSCFYNKVKEDCCESCSKHTGCVADASPFCAKFILDDAEYVCNNYRSVCCKSCESVNSNSLFARSAKADPSILEARARIDSVLKKASDPNSLIDLTKEHLKNIPSSKQIEKAGIPTQTTTTTEKPDTTKTPRRQRPRFQRPRAGPNVQRRRPVRPTISQPTNQQRPSMIQKLRDRLSQRVNRFRSQRGGRPWGR